MSFDIPSQPLAKALHAFSATTGIEVMVDARQAVGRIAPEVKGTMLPQDALTVLLAGSSLVPRAFDEGTVTLTATTPAAPALDDQRYFTDIQLAIGQALCADSRTAPGSYRLALKLWVGPSGQVTRARRLDSTGDRGRDGLVDDMLPRISIGKPPPPHFVQPVALVVSPGASASTSVCSAGLSAPHAGKP